jgi:hypothetical protein
MRLFAPEVIILLLDGSALLKGIDPCDWEYARRELDEAARWIESSASTLDKCALCVSTLDIEQTRITSSGRNDESPRPVRGELEDKSIVNEVVSALEAVRSYGQPVGWMSPAIYAAERRSAALRSTDGSAPRTAAITAQADTTEPQTPITAG